MKIYKKVLFVLPATVGVFPIASLVACGGTEVDNNEQNVLAASDNTDQIKDLTTQLNELKDALNLKQISVNANNMVLSDNQQQINDLKDQIQELKTKIEVLSNKKSEQKETLESKVIALQSFVSANQASLSKIDFDELKNDVDPELPWQRGIGVFSLSQAAFYIYNLALQLGYHKQISEIYDLALSDKTVDSEIAKEQTLVFNYVKKMFDDVKPATADKLNLALSAPLYKGYSYLYSTGSKMSLRKLVNCGLDVSSFGLNDRTGNPLDLYSNQAADTQVFPNFTFNDGKENIDLFYKSLSGMQYINGEKPGSTFTQIYVPATTKTVTDANGSDTEIELTPAFTKEIEVENSYQTYEKSDDSETEDNLVLLEALLKKMSVIFNDESEEYVATLRKDAQASWTSQELINSFDYLGRHYNTEDGFDMTDVKNAYLKLNNGSHYFKAVQVFARGVKNLPFANLNSSTPSASGSESFDGIISMSNDHLTGQLLQWGKVLMPGAYKFGTDTFAYADPINYKPTIK